MQDLYIEVSTCYLTYAGGLTELQCQKKNQIHAQVEYLRTKDTNLIF